MGMELEWRLQIMTKVGNAIMENGGFEREGEGTREFEKLLEEANGRLFLRRQFWGMHSR
jgi:hypothetical protein